MSITEHTGAGRPANWIFARCAETREWVHICGVYVEMCIYVIRCLRGGDGAVLCDFFIEPRSNARDVYGWVETLKARTVLPLRRLREHLAFWVTLLVTQPSQYYIRIAGLRLIWSDLYGFFGLLGTRRDLIGEVQVVSFFFCKQGILHELFACVRM